MSIPFRSDQRSYLVWVTAFVGVFTLALLVSCAVFHPFQSNCPDQPAKFILTFGEDPPNPSHRVTVDVGAFERALKMHAPNWKCQLKKVVTPQGPEEDVVTKKPIPADPTTVTIAHVTIPAPSQPGVTTMHVTQKVALDNPAQVAAVLAALR